MRSSHAGIRRPGGLLLRAVRPVGKEGPLDQ
jgi:hypothetical protein